MIKAQTHTVTVGLVLSTVPGYSETFFRNKIKGLQNAGFEVVLFVDYTQKTDVDFPCRIVASPQFVGPRINKVFTVLGVLFKALFLQPKRSFALYQLDKKDGIIFKNRFRNIILNQFLLGETLDWLHFGYGKLAHGRENVAEAIGAKMAVSFRGFDLYLSPLKHPGCYDLLFKKEVRYHVLSHGMKQRLKDNLISDQKIHVITPAINTAFFSHQKPIATMDDNVINIVTIARLHWIKGLEYTLEALAKVKQKQIKFKYTIIGDGEEKERLVYATHELGIAEDVFFPGKLSHNKVKEILKTTSIYLQYSIQEGFCNAVLEAQAMGLLCIVSDAEGLKENVLDTQTGWVVPKRQPEVLARKIIEVSKMSKSEQQEITTQAVSRVNKLFNLERQNLLFREFYEC
ncbi:glycosyltransferase family 4 protein [Xanthomarina sp. F2636L]|uniref:glycosyltransferase family 4 protein n=1 Tax=Xanthomarina sp. F2636L TaxID=2996018 RepID=UPI00225E1D3D|nr:glycosyltransferase family 4 protein [Xanthomarina sp. F2636L]MCX7549376.1 glycosyltransferase family 4 protein [Xanthomarina sp. F2636L]